MTQMTCEQKRAIEYGIDPPDRRYVVNEYWAAAQDDPGRLRYSLVVDNLQMVHDYLRGIVNEILTEMRGNTMSIEWGGPWPEDVIDSRGGTFGPLPDGSVFHVARAITLSENVGATSIRPQDFTP